MDSSLPSNQLLIPKNIVKKRPSTETLEPQDSKKRNLVQRATPHTTTSYTPTVHLTTDSRISVDEDDQSLAQPNEDFQATLRARVLRRTNRAGEEEKLTTGRCHECDESGPIFTHPQCRHCFHNRCEHCDWEEEYEARDRQAALVKLKFGLFLVNGNASRKRASL